MEILTRFLSGLVLAAIGFLVSFLAFPILGEPILIPLTGVQEFFVYSAALLAFIFGILKPSIGENILRFFDFS